MIGRNYSSLGLALSALLFGSPVVGAAPQCPAAPPFQIPPFQAPNSPSPAGPETPGAQPGAQPGPTTPRGAGPATGKKNRGATTGEDQWQSWWRYNKHAYIQIVAGPNDAQVSGALGFLNGAAGSTDSEDTGVSAIDVKDRVLPLLRGVMDSEDDALVHDALMSLARVTSAEDAGEVLGDLRRALKSSSADVRHSAILALGVLGHASAAPTLHAIMKDTKQGRSELASKGSIKNVERASAVLAFGMVCRPRMAGYLYRFVEDQAAKNHELAEVGVAAIGLLSDPPAEAVTFLLELTEDGRQDDRLRAQAPIALARLGELSAPTTPALLRILKDRRAPRTVRHSCAVALGQLASSEKGLTEVFVSIIQSETDAVLRHFSTMALARMAALSNERAGIVTVGAQHIVSELLSAFERPSQRADLPWLALGLGVCGRSFPKHSAERMHIVEALSRSFGTSRNPAVRGAHALALGMNDGVDSAGALLDAFSESEDGTLRGHLAVALGMMRYEAAKGALLQELAERNPSQIRVDLAVGLGLMGDGEAAENVLRGQVEGSTDSYERQTSVLALARLRRPQSIETIGDLIASPQSTREARFGCIAMGALADKHDLPWYTQLSAESNYLLQSRLQQEIIAQF